VKLAPVVRALEASPHWHPVVISSGQHGDVVAEVLAAFELAADRVLPPWPRDGELAGLHAELVSRLAAEVAAVRPEVVVVQGDTATTMAGALTAFWAGVPVAHVEAGLRSGDLANPFPEEANRRIVTQVASLHLAPTSTAVAALHAEGVDPRSVVLTGNTVVDALLALRDRAAPRRTDRPLLLVTCHRRENWGAPLREVAAALRDLACSGRDLDIELVTHLNPVVRSTLQAELDGVAGVAVRGPLPYADFLGLLQRATLVLTDSGGVQEEAPTFGVPTLVMRDATERPEGIASGFAALVGTDRAEVFAQVARLLDDPTARRSMVAGANPYGDGRAAERSVAALSWFLGRADKPAPFDHNGRRDATVGERS
jgi:UDP-N-acetylglucosamine 2-epimerase (non-hydrolysing)